MIGHIIELAVWSKAVWAGLKCRSIVTRYEPVADNELQLITHASIEPYVGT